MELAVETLGLTKYYGRRRGIEDVDLAVATGEVFGFLGPNGAGKSTTIRLLLDLIRPTRGSARVLGVDPREGSTDLRGRLGYLPGDLELYRDLTGRQLCRYFGSIRGVDVADAVAVLAERLDLDLDRRIGDYSTGNRQKVGLVQAFMHQPDLLILDEPTAGLDPLMQQEFYALVAEASAAGRTVFLSSHVLPEVEHVADRVAIIRDGRIVVIEDLAVLKQQAVRSFEIDFEDPVDPRELASLDSVVSVEAGHDGRRLLVRVAGPIDQVVKAAARHTVLNLVSHDGDLEEVFLHYYRGDGAPVPEPEIDMAEAESESEAESEPEPEEASP